MYRDDAVVPHIGETYPLERAAEAIEAIGTRQVLGKVLIDVAPEAAQ
jgi:D-arabinose 1-dehydrogenase-like Zn-dependent alcohol dehydrogenase